MEHAANSGFGKLSVAVVILLLGGGYYYYQYRTGAAQTGDDLLSSLDHVRTEAAGKPLGAGHGTGGVGARGKHVTSDMPALDSTPLIDAATKGDKEAVLRQLEKFPVNGYDNRQHTALMGAALNGQDEICALLIKKGAVATLEDIQGYNAMDYAASNGQVETVRLLLEKAKLQDKADYVEYAQLIKATSAANASFLPQGHGNFNTVNRMTADGRSPLHISASMGSVDIASTLIRHGANVNLANKDGQTPLHWAAWNNRLFIISLLLKNDAAIDATDLGGNTPLMLAARHGNKEAVTLLLQKGADKTLLNIQKKSAGDIANENSYSELANLLN